MVTETIVARLLASRPASRILIVAEGFHQDRAFALLRLGVKGLVPFGEAPRHLRRAVREVARGGFWASRSLLSRFIDSTVRALPAPARFAVATHLSRREQEVCGLLLENLSNREIAGRLKVSERTAKFHVANLLGKFGLRRRSDLMVMSYSRQYVEERPLRDGWSGGVRGG